MESPHWSKSGCQVLKNAAEIPAELLRHFPIFWLVKYPWLSSPFISGHCMVYAMVCRWYQSQINDGCIMLYIYNPDISIDTSPFWWWYPPIDGYLHIVMVISSFPLGKYPCFCWLNIFISVGEVSPFVWHLWASKHINASAVQTAQQVLLADCLRDWRWVAIAVPSGNLTKKNEDMMGICPTISNWLSENWG